MRGSAGPRCGVPGPAWHSSAARPTCLQGRERWEEGGERGQWSACLQCCRVDTAFL